MATVQQGVPEINYMTFAKGLVTETTPVGYVRGSLSDGDNVVIKRTGDLCRRLGFKDVAGLPTGTDWSYFHEISFLWAPSFVGGDYSVAPLLTVAGRNSSGVLCLYFFTYSSSSSTLSYKGYVSLSGLSSNSNTSIDEDGMQFAAGLGALYVTGTYFYPFYVTTNSDYSSFTLKQINIVIRDFDGVNDGLATDQEPSTLSAEHHYNLLNQGWYKEISENGYDTVTTYSSYDNSKTTKSQWGANENGYINGYHTANGYYPPNNKVWYMVKTSAGGADNQKTEKLCVGSGSVAKGHYLVDATYIDYSAVSGVSGLTAKSNTVPSVTAFYAGRAWFAADNILYFSQVISPNNLDMAGMCYQAQDPTAEDLNALLASDGGKLIISEAANIIRMYAVGPGLLVLASNGVWFVSGTSAGFSATDYSVSKLSSVGCSDANSLVEAGGIVFWFAPNGVAAYAPGETVYAGGGGVQIITDAVIKSWYIENYAAYLSSRSVYAAFDNKRNLVEWIIYNPSEAVSQTTSYGSGQALVLDLTLKAFYTYSWSNPRSAYTAANGPGDRPFNLHYHVQNDTATSTLKTNDGFLYLRGIRGSGGSGNITSLRAVMMSDDTCLDWEDSYAVDGIRGGGLSYTSFLEVGAELADDMVRLKQMPYLIFYLRQSGSGCPYLANPSSSGTGLYYQFADYFTDSSSYTYAITYRGSTWDIIPLGGQALSGYTQQYSTYALALAGLESLVGGLGRTLTANGRKPYPVYSCKMRAMWDFSETSTSNRWGSSAEMYRARYTNIDTDTWVVAPDFSVVASKNRVRGHGRAVKYRIECSDAATNFNILGWSTWMTGNSAP